MTFLHMMDRAHYLQEELMLGHGWMMSHWIDTLSSLI